MARKVAGGWIFRFETDAGGRAGPAAQSRRTCRLSGFRRRSGCVPAEPYPPLEQSAKRALPVSVTLRVYRAGKG
jgi:hypothetical protein